MDWFLYDNGLRHERVRIEGFTTSYRQDRNDEGGGRLLYIREDIPSRLLQCKSQCSIER